MRITDIKEARVSIASDIANAYISFAKMDVSILAIYTDAKVDGRQVVGYGFNSNGRYAQSGLLRERFLPRLQEADAASLVDDSGRNLDPFKVWATVMANEKPGGHGERSVAVGVIDMAIWDIVAKVENKPLAQLLAERHGDGETDRRVSVYAAGGYYHPGKEIRGLQDEMRDYLDMGYVATKMKIGGAPLDEDLSRVEAALEIVGDASRLAVDANGRFDLQTTLQFADGLAPYGVRWYEEAGDPLDYALQRQLCEHYAGPTATGENLFSHQDVRNLLRHGGMRPDRDILQMDPVLSYGLVEYLRMLDELHIRGWSTRQCIPHGGHQFALNIAAGLKLGGNESYPRVFAPFGGFADSTPVEDGLVAIPDRPGIGFEDKAELMKVFHAHL
ncbi:mandelate racemase/muconate lactonizing enzyme family protein [Halomonas sp. McH1-25]|uniref:mandelate racemase/muconate lactonizing enzyme family protein n=1 Tax=unclassified Halomonas TaxID=2609666 RepID=UPI001EF6B2B2|nr:MULTISPECIES: mandelate racemase/muconate lactonizing enzyme family protein [unclassified Halomonas]MCG7599786.1 mandelate racemase/muconate lactonizing enzyme family protein [Halomonas sp. McH1-25]MCP1341681.1 mandelate racemase/muconate lactonizing enzyme family protein [Halomonas sp. FL8]MCP1359839.1 mandelate racemase/muconate lactonizing enzyme family protein [Halomonas sp. BBD45]